MTAASESIKWIKACIKCWINCRSRFDEVIANGDAMAASALLREGLLAIKVNNDNCFSPLGGCQGEFC